MEMFYENRDMIRCLEVAYSREEQRDISSYEYQIKMIEANQIPYLLNVCVIHMDNQSKLRFLTEDSYVFSRRFQYIHMDGRVLLETMRQINQCMETLALYLLPTDNLVLNPDYMFFDVKEECVRLVYIPGYRHNLRTQIKQLLEYMMRVFDFSDREGIHQLYKIYNKVCEDKWESKGLCQMLPMDVQPVGYNQQAGAQERRDCYSETETDLAENRFENDITDSEKPEGGLFYRIKQLRVMQRGLIGIAISLILAFLAVYFLGNRTIFWLYLAAGVCVLLAIYCAYAFAEEEENEDEAMHAYRQLMDDNAAISREQDFAHSIVNDNQIHALVPLTNGSLDEMIFSEYGEKITVGRGKNEADYRLPAAEISRVHAYIYQKEGGFFLEDLKSQNGTYLNSVRIPSNEIKKLNRGDIIGFANEEFFVS